MGNILDGVKRFDVVVRFDEESRDDIEKIRAIPIHTQTGSLVPLGKVADISLSSGLARVRRESLSRYIVIQGNVVGRDLGGFVSEAQKKIAQKIKLPQGYHMEWGGQFENQRRAMGTLSIVVPVTIFLIFVLLYTAFNSVKYALLIISNVPFSAIWRHRCVIDHRPVSIGALRYRLHHGLWSRDAKRSSFGFLLCPASKEGDGSW